VSEAAQPSDASALAALLTESLPHHPTSERRLRRAFFQCDGFDPSLARVVRDARGRIDSIVAVVRLPDDEKGPRARLSLMATRAERRRQGLARKLYAEVETELRRRGVREIAIEGDALLSGLDLRYTPAATMLLRRLYVPTQVGYDMTLAPGRPVTESPEVAGFSFRPLAPEDKPALRTLCEAEFPGWRFAPELVRPGEPCGVVGAFAQDGSLAAFAGWNEYVFGPTGTAEIRRRKGLGEAVFRRAVRAMREAGFEKNICIGFANIGYYARAFGCHIRGTIWRMRKDLAGDPAISKGK